MRTLTDSIALLKSAQESLKSRPQRTTSSAASDLLDSKLFIDLLTLAQDYNSRSGTETGRAHANLAFLTSLCDVLIDTFSNGPKTIYKTAEDNKALATVPNYSGGKSYISIFSPPTASGIRVNIVPISHQHYDKILCTSGDFKSDRRLVDMYINVMGVFEDVVHHTIENTTALKDEKHVGLAATLKRADTKGLFYRFKGHLRHATSSNSLQTWLKHFRAPTPPKKHGLAQYEQISPF